MSTAKKNKFDHGGGGSVAINTSIHEGVMPITSPVNDGKNN